MLPFVLTQRFVLLPALYEAAEHEEQDTGLREGVCHHQVVQQCSVKQEGLVGANACIVHNMPDLNSSKELCMRERLVSLWSLSTFCAT